MTSGQAPAAALVVLIMAGGAGTRFWPASTHSRPKQLLRLIGKRSLLQQSFDRARLLAAPERILVLTSEELVEAVRAQLPEVPGDNVVGEPLRRDTAAAVCLGALLCRRRFGDCVMAVLTADHRIEPGDDFARVLHSAARVVESDPVLYTVGIPPTYPATGFGYLKRGVLALDDDGLLHYELQGFREKPDAATAAAYVASGKYLWNSGMFVWRVSAILGEYDRHLPGHLEALAEATTVEVGSIGRQALRAAFEGLSAVSVDYAIMEKAARVRTVEATFSWCDLGGWLAMEEFLGDDGGGNRVRGRVAAVDSSGNLVFNEDDDELVALLGVKDLVVVRAGHRTLVADRSRVEDLKALVRRIEDQGLTDEL
ncbi:MAG: sugar phosphate nucleotidyltransferase [Thermoleophilia bacterium]|nr:sugar phosphate nucleotidyltransferase [Thermoleophilia bacterium]